MRLNGKICVITGGGGGIGEAAARLFAKQGARVVIVEIDEQRGRSVAEDIGENAIFVQADVSDAKSVKNAFDQIRTTLGGLDVLYNNASVFLGKQDAPVTELDLDSYHKIIGINQNSIVYCCKYAIPLMIQHAATNKNDSAAGGGREAGAGGCIINTASSAGVIGIPGCDAYTASKGATVALTRSLAVEYGPQKIRVNCIAPAAIDTPMVRQSNLNDPDFDEQQFLNTTPLRRWGTPEDIAKVALFLASDDSAYINGAIIVADGGITIT